MKTSSKEDIVKKWAPPTGTLFYLDFNYGESTKNYKKTRRAGKKHKKKEQ